MPDNLPLHASLNREYALRLLGVALLFLGLSGWFLYDGTRGYPAENARVAPIAAELAQTPRTPADWVNPAKTGTAPLVEAFRAHGLKCPAKYLDGFTSWVRAGDPKANDPKAAAALLSQPLHSAEEVHTQFISAGIGLVAAAALLGLLAVRKLTRLTLTETHLIHHFAGRECRYPLDELCALDDRQWQKRAIAKACFRSGTVTLDAWHHAGIRPLHDALARKCPATPAQETAP